MATQKQRSAAKRNVKRAQSGAKRKQTLKNLPKSTKRALGREGTKVRRGTEKSRQEYYEEAAGSTSPAGRGWARRSWGARYSAVAHADRRRLRTRNPRL